MMNANNNTINLCNSELDDSINLDDLLPGCTALTWLDKKAFCAMEAKKYADAGLWADDNPYITGTWSWRWFNEAFLDYAEPFGKC